MRPFPPNAAARVPAGILARAENGAVMFQFEPRSLEARGAPIRLPGHTRQQEADSAREAGHDKGTAVIVCTRGRPDIIHSLVKELSEQTKPPEHIFIIASQRDDVALL